MALLAGMMVIGTAGAATADDHDKVWVCKYVGQKGAETLKPGQNPIAVAAPSATDGGWFSDTQELSYVLEPQTSANTGEDNMYAGTLSCPGDNPPGNDPTDVAVSASADSVCVDESVTFTLTNTGSGTTTYVGELVGPGGTLALGEFTLAEGASQSRSDTPTVPGSYTVTFWVKGEDSVRDSVTVMATDCVAVPNALQPVDPCGAGNIAWPTELPQGVGFTWSVNEQNQLVATTVGSAKFEGGKTTHTFDLPPEVNLAPCSSGNPPTPPNPPNPPAPTVVTPAVAFVEATCLDLDGSAIDGAVDTAGIDFSVVGEPGLGETVNVIAQAKDGFAFPAGAIAEWTHTFTTEAALDCDTVGGIDTDDVCPNIEGLQESVPNGYELKGSTCVKERDVLGEETEEPNPQPNVGGEDGEKPGEKPGTQPGNAPTVEGVAQEVPTAVDAGLGAVAPTGSAAAGTLIGQGLVGGGLVLLLLAGWMQRGRIARGAHQL